MSVDRVLERKTYAEGGVIFKEGDVGNLAYVVQEGSVNIVKIVDGEPKVLGNIAKGGIFGEMALIDDQPRMAQAVAAEPVTLIVVTRQMFDEKLKKADPFIRGLLHVFADNIRRLGSK